MPATTAATSTIDPASRIDREDQDPRVVQMVSAPPSWGLFDYFLDTLVFTVASAMIGMPLKVAFGLKSARMTVFMQRFIDAAHIGTPVILVALVYLIRIRQNLEIDSEEWVCERLALGALITAYKYTNDAHGKADHWARATGTLTKADVNRIEREFLRLLNFDMRVTDADLLAHADDIARATRNEPRTYPAPGRDTTIFARSERTEYRYPIHPRAESPPHARRHASPIERSPSPPALPDLMYPDSPRSYESTPPVITPPERRRASGAAARKPAPTRNPYLARGMDPEMEARVRWYAYEGPRADSPRFEPFSPPTTRYVRPSVGAGAQEAYPWRRYASQHDVWGTAGLFKI
ncbi:hypothetical protein BD413DRAFT_474289 [Trametes elegans]|nr:hypothetical protein BD413DRAFT_474289 [Trametes elegans]